MGKEEEGGEDWSGATAWAQWKRLSPRVHEMVLV